ncbi:sensor histidine kinase [Hyphomicrobium sp.]|uniref:sensor histidine kinase n=1 Tax=Hyphomicrobium sp. TaxID=82 RepID=UPI003F72C691
MRLLPLLILRLMGVVLLCLALAIGCLIYDAHRSIESDVSATAARVNSQLQGLYWHRLLLRNGMEGGNLMPLPEWKSVSTQSIISPGVCVTFAPPGSDQQTLCSQVEVLGPPAPQWFATAYLGLLGRHEAIAQPLSLRDATAGVVATSAEPDAALRRAWREVSTVVKISAMMAGGIAILAAFIVGHALLPARAIIDALRRLEEGQLALRLTRFRSTEFNHIANAVNRLAATLFQTHSERLALTNRLFQVQEDERRALARDLHDEFGQALTATSALATLIESGAPADRPDIAKDARSIAKAQSHMMDALRSTLVRLRSQSIEEVGLEASLRQLINDFNAQSNTGTVFKLQMSGSIADLHKRIAVDLYRIVQECLTNASKHGRPTEVSVRLEHVMDRAPHVSLTVEDNGGGDVSKVRTSSGHGILGIRERLAGLGGALSIGNAPRGLRILAIVPVGPPAAFA